VTDDGDVADLSGLDCGHAKTPSRLVCGDLSEGQTLSRFRHERVTDTCADRQ
jgi:hypothetical protein